MRLRLSLMIAGSVLLLWAGSGGARSQGAAIAPPGNAECRDYSMQAAIDGTPGGFVGHDCHAPDGRWQVVKGVPQSGPLVPAIQPPPVVYYPYGGWLVGPPARFSAGSFVLFGRPPFHQFHAFPRFHRFSHFAPRFRGGARHHFGGFGMRSFGMAGGHR